MVVHDSVAAYLDQVPGPRPARPITAEATGPAGAVVTFERDRHRPRGRRARPGCDPASGSTFPLGDDDRQLLGADSAAHTRYRTFTSPSSTRRRPPSAAPRRHQRPGRRARRRRRHLGPPRAPPTSSTAPVAGPATRPRGALPGRRHDRHLHRHRRGRQHRDGTFKVTVAAYVDHGPRSSTVPDRPSPPRPPAPRRRRHLRAPTAVRPRRRRAHPELPDPASGSTFPLGDTTVTCTATDAPATPSPTPSASPSSTRRRRSISGTPPTSASRPTGPAAPSSP